jgi:hypothetical protein
MNDITNLMHTLGANVRYRQFHEGTVEGHTQTPRRASPLASTEPKEDLQKALYDPEGARFESHPIDERAMPPTTATQTVAAEQASWQPDRRHRLDTEIWGDVPAASFSRYAPKAAPPASGEAEAPQARSRLLTDIFARLEQAGRQDSGGMH